MKFQNKNQQKWLNIKVLKLFEKWIDKHKVWTLFMECKMS